jgi:hypothetical protein
VVNVGINKAGTANYPITLNGGMTINMTGSNSSNITLNDLFADIGTITATYGSGTSNNTLSFEGDGSKTPVIETLNNITITSKATGINTFNFQNTAGTLVVGGTIKFKATKGINVVNLATNGNNSGVKNAILELLNSSTTTSTGSSFDGGPSGPANSFFTGVLGTNLFYLNVPLVTNF